jgi:hypothetical protein
LSRVSLSGPYSVRMSARRFLLLCNTPWARLRHDVGRVGPLVLGSGLVVVCRHVWEGVCDVGE